MIHNIETLLSDENAQKCAIEIMERFRDGTNNVEKEMAEKSNEGAMSEEDTRNTTYLFDPVKGSCLDNLVEAFIHGDETRLPEIGDFEKMDEFLLKVNKIIEEIYSEVMKEAARKRILGNAPPELYPIRSFKMLEIYLSNPVIDFVVVPQKEIMVKRSVLDEAKDTKDIFKGSVKGENVGNELGEIHISTGKPFEQIIAEKKAMGDPKYKNVVGAYKKKAFYKVEVDMIFDYEPIEKEVLFEQLKTKFGPETEIGKKLRKVLGIEEKPEKETIVPLKKQNKFGSMGQPGDGLTKLE